MGKNKDLIQILIIIIIGMFIPFLGSIIIIFGLDITNMNNIFKIASTFIWFLIIFAIELILVFFYYSITNKIAGKKMDKYKTK